MEMVLSISKKCEYIAVRSTLFYPQLRCTSLDKIGDTSTKKERKKYFREIDKDKSDGIDFEEFLEVSLFYIV